MFLVSFEGSLAVGVNLSVVEENLLVFLGVSLVILEINLAALVAVL